MVSNRLKRERRRSTVTGAVVLLSFLAMMYVAFTSTNGLPGTKHVKVEVAFTDVGALREGDDVRFGGIRVGKVDKLELVDGKPVAKLSLDAKRKVFRDATARIAQRSSLGQAYVDVTPGNPAQGALPPGQPIIASNAESAQDLANVLNALDVKTRASLRTLVSETGHGADGHGKDLNAALSALPKALPNLGTVADALTVNNGQSLTTLLTETKGLSQAFAGQQRELADLVRQLDKTLAAVSTDGGTPLAETLKQAPGTLTSVRDGLAALTQPLQKAQKAVTVLQSGAKSLGDATPALRSVLREGIPPLDKVPSVMDKTVRPVGDLTVAIRDLRPLAPRVARAIEDASTPLAVLRPYAPEAALWFTYAASVLHEGDDAGHWLRFYPIIHTETISGVLPIKDPFTNRHAYPAPGEAQLERSTSILGTRK